MAKDFKAKQLRTTQIIASGSSVGSIPSLLIYSASVASDVDGNYSAAMTTDVGTDVWMFVSGAKNDSGLANDDHTNKVLFAGDVVVSGTLYAEKQIMEVDLSQNSDLFLSGAVILGDQGAAPDGNGQLRLYQSIGANSGSIFVSTGSIYLGANSGGNYSETEITPKVYQADNGLGSQVISSTNTSFHLDINSLSGSLTNSTIDASDLFAVADVDATNNEAKKITLSNVAAKLAGDGITATTGVLAATARNGINVSSSGIEISLTDVSGSSAIATGDSIPFLDTDGSTQISTVAQLVTALAGDGLSNSSNQFQVGVDDSTIERNSDQLRVKDDGITAAKINSDVAGTGLEQHTDGSIRIATGAAGTGLSGGGGSALSLDLNELSDAVVAVGSDSIAIIDADDNSTKKESITDLVSGIAGTPSNTGLSASSGVLSVDINALGADSNAGNVADSIAIADASDSNTVKKITITQLKALVDTDTTYTAGNGLDLAGTEFSLDLYLSGGLKIEGADGELAIEPNDFAGTGLEDDGSDNLRIAATAAGTGLTGGGGSALSIDTNVVQKTIYAVTGSGTHGFGTGDAAAASGTDSFAIGRRSSATGNYSVAIGASQSTNSNTASGLSAAALGGDNATASGDYSAVLGGTGNTASGDYSAVLGRSSTAAGNDSIAIGKSLTATEADSIAIGNSSNNAKIALSGSVEVFSTTVLNGDTTVSEGADLLVSGYVKHLSDTDTSIQFNTNRVRLNAGGSTYIDLNTNQVSLHSSDASANTDVNFFVSGSIGAKDGTTKGTALFGGDVHISGSLHGIDELVFDSTDTKIFRDGSVLKFDDASNDVKTLSQLAATGVSTEHFEGVHGANPATSKLKTTASVAFAGALDDFVDGLASDGVGVDTFVFFSGSVGSRGTTTRGVTLFGGDSVFSGSATYLGTTAFTSLSATGDVTAGGSFVADGDLIKNSNGDKVLKFSSSTSATLIADSSVIDSTTPSAFLHIENAENVQAATTNETSNFNILLRNSSTQTNAFAGIAFDVSTELDADSIGAAIRGERDTAASTNATLHDTNLTFSTNDAGDSGLTERMRITHDGKVGIGTNNPLESLHISGDLRIDGDDIKDSGGNIVLSFDGSGNIDNNVDFTGTVDFESFVNVSQYIQHLGDTDTRLVFNDDQISIEVGGVGFMTFTENGSQDTVVFNEGSNDIDFRIESNLETHMFYVDANTNRIGMGISGPTTTLEIKGASADETAVQIKDSQSSDTIVKLYHANGQDDGIIDVYTNNTVFTQINGSGDSFFRKNSTSEGAHLGIGRYDTTINSGDEIAQLEFQGSENNSTWYTQAAIQSKANVAWGTYRGSDLRFYTTATNSTTLTERMVLDGSGNLQIDGDLTLTGNDIIGTALNLDSSGNITLDADGGTITFSDAGVSLGTITSAGYSGNAASATNIAITNETATNAERYIVFVDSSSGNNAPKVDSGGLAFNPDNNILIIGRSTNPGTVRSGGSLTLDSAGDIALSADGDQITMDDGTTTRFTFNVDATPQIDVVGDFTIDGSGDVVIDGADDVIIKNNGTQRIQIEDSTGDVAIGTHDPVYRLDVIDDTSSFVAQIRNDSTAAGADLLVMDFQNQSSPDGQIIYVYGGAGHVYSVRGDGDGTSTVSTTFTGFHDTATLQDSDMIPGMIVESTGVSWVKDPSNNYHNMLPYTRLCSDNGSSKVFGVTAKDNQQFVFQADGTKIANTNLGGLRKGEFGGLVTNNPMADDHIHLSVMALGEGAIWVTNIGGDITNGDLIESSEIAGYGRLQSDDLMRSKTVAKCTETIDWTAVTDTIQHEGVTYKKYLTCCTFHCG